jgi:hypothetical protein
MEATAQDPSAWRCLFRHFGNHGHDVIPVARVREFKVDLDLTNAHEVAMTLNETRDRELAFEVNHLGGRAREGLHFCGGANREDAAILNGNGSPLRTGWIERYYFAVGED